jgi:uncharacterized protein
MHHRTQISSDAAPLQRARGFESSRWLFGVLLLANATVACGTDASSGNSNPSSAGATTVGGASNAAAGSVSVSGNAGTLSTSPAGAAGVIDVAGSGGATSAGAASGGSGGSIALGGYTASDGYPTVAVGPGAADLAPPGQLKVAYHGKFLELPVGAVTAQGWLKSWLLRQDQGLTGHPENLAYPYDTGMYAVGKIPDPKTAHGDNWWRYEQSGYFVDAVSRLSSVVDAPNASKIADANVNYIAAHSGPAKLGESTTGWPNAVVGRSLMAAYGKTGDMTRPRALITCTKGSNSLGYRDGYIAEEAFYLYGLTGDAALLNVATRAYNAYFLNDSSQFSYIDKINGTGNLITHGVTAAEQLKLLPLMYSYTGNAQALDLAQKAFKKIEANSLMPDGGMVSSENLGTTAFNSLHETCDLSDWSWTMGYLLMAAGEPHWADLIEKTVFNALPGAVTKDFKQLQYFSSVNQIAATNTICPRISKARMSYRAAQDTECCAGNVNRAVPNYVTRMWMGMPGGLAATLYGPSEVKVVINQQPVTITEVTDYPFRDTVTFKVSTSAPVSFSLALRIPEWASGATIGLNGSNVLIDTRAGSFVTLGRSFANGDSIVLHLPMAVKLANWLGNSAVSVERGPLVYSLKIDETRTESTSDPDSVKSGLKGNNIEGFPAVQFTPASEWRYGMSVAQKGAPESFTVVESSALPENPFDSSNPPVKIVLPLKPLPQWQASWNAANASENPTALPTSAERSSAGTAQMMTLVPYGSTYSRLTMIPVLP